jgi:magnesium-transporting ATPase (P-type)
MRVDRTTKILFTSMNWEVTTLVDLTSELGFERICEKLQVDVKVGLSGSDFTERKERFGDNFRPEAVAKSWISLFFGALEDFMLRALIVCAIFSIVFEMILATPDHRKEGKN